MYYQKELQILPFWGSLLKCLKTRVFTVEYSVRCAQTAVYGLFATEKEVLPVYDSIYKPETLLKAVKTISK